jgi:hypothetical protein
MEFFTENLMIIVTIAIALAFVVFIFVLRSRSEPKHIGSGEHPFSDVDSNVEYEWKVKPNLFVRLMILLLIIGSAVWLWLNVDFLQDLVSDFGQLWFVGIWVISVLGGTAKSYHYAMTGKGIIRKELVTARRLKKPEMLFTWDQISWFKPTNDGFRYYLKDGIKKESKESSDSDPFKFIFKSSGYVKWVMMPLW